METREQVITRCKECTSLLGNQNTSTFDYQLCIFCAQSEDEPLQLRMTEKGVQYVYLVVHISKISPYNTLQELTDAVEKGDGNWQSTIRNQVTFLVIWVVLAILTFIIMAWFL